MSNVNNSGLLLARLDLIDADESDIHISWVRVAAREAAARIRELNDKVARLEKLIREEIMPRYAELFEAVGLGDVNQSVIVDLIDATLAAQPSTPAEDEKG